MINDILFSLLGITGGIIIETEQGFRVNSKITTLSQSEVDSLSNICEIGTKYKILKDFLSNYESLYNSNLILNSIVSKPQKEDLSSIYLSGVCRTISSILTSYSSHIEQLESKYYNDNSLTIADIISSISPFAVAFNKLHELLQYIYQNDLKGGAFLNFIYEKGICGDPNVKGVFKKLFINCNVILNNMISMWIINNAVTSNEFFIVSANNFIVNNANGNKSDVVAYTFGNSDLDSWNANFYIEKNNLPFYFPISLAEDILFVGKAIKILNSNKNSDEWKVSFNDMSIFYSSLQKLNNLIFKENEDMNNLIDIELYSKIITLIKNCVSKLLWKLVVNKNGFLKHLTGVRNIFLTFHGEFYYNFISKIQNLLNLPNFDKKIENEINDVYFKNSLKEVFHIDTDSENYNVYNAFKIKLISSGFNYNFQNETNVKGYLSKKEISFYGGLNYDTVSSSFRLINTTYKSLNGALWNLSNYDLDEEFLMSSNFVLKNFTKKESFNQFEINERQNSLLKRNKTNINDRKIYINNILHIAKNYPTHPPLSLNDLMNFFNFQFILSYDDQNDTSALTSISFRLYHKNTQKEILLKEDGLKQASNSYKQIDEHEIEIYTITFNDRAKVNEIIQGANEINNIQIAFKENYCTISNESKSMNFSFPFMINQFIPKDKRKMIVGLIISSDNIDMIFELINWNFNFFSGEIYNENSNLILINYNPPWPHNFIFNENILKMYNNIFNLVFPLKTSLTMMNQLWVEKKNICNNNVNIFKILDSVHAEFTCFLQNLISFYMFDVIEVKFKQFFEKMSKCKDLEDLMKIHEEFLGEVITNSFVKSKKIMRTIFDVLFVVRKFHNYVQNMLVNLTGAKVLNNEQNNFNNYFEEKGEQIKGELLELKDEFKLKVKNLINCFSKIKNTKHFTIISQLLAKLDYNNNMDI